MKNIAFAVMLSCITTSYTFAQVGIGTTNPENSSILHVESTDKGVLIPKLTTAQENAILNPAEGLLVYNTETKDFKFNRGTTVLPNWIKTSRHIAVKYSNTDIATDVNNNAAINTPILGTLEWNDDTTVFTANTVNHTITVSQTGRYRISVNVSLVTSSSTARLTPEMWIEINGTQRGTFGSTGYIRSNNNHDESSIHINEVFQLNAGDVISVAIIRTANAGNVYLRSVGSSNIYIEKI